MRNVAAVLKTLPLVLLCGCFMSTKPTGDTGFARAEDLSAFVGYYANVGEVGKGDSGQLLSAAIWPETDVDHKAIEVIKVDEERSDTLHVSAIGGGRVLKESRFVKGTDFQLSDGQIKLKTHVVGSAGTEPGNPAIGVGTEATVLGIDKAGNGRMLGSGNFVGTVFLMFPVAIHGSDATRFKKLSTCNGS